MLIFKFQFLDKSILLVYLYILSMLHFINFFKKDFYLFTHERHRKKVETQAKGEAGSVQGAQCGTRFQNSRIMP